MTYAAGAGVLAAAPASRAGASASGAVTTIDVPGASPTTATGVGDRGQIVGWYVNAIGQHGFEVSRRPSGPCRPGSEPILHRGLGCPYPQPRQTAALGCPSAGSTDVVADVEAEPGIRDAIGQLAMGG